MILRNLKEKIGQSLMQAGRKITEEYQPKHLAKEHEPKHLGTYSSEYWRQHERDVAAYDGEYLVLDTFESRLP